MRTEKEICDEIDKVKKDYYHVLYVGGPSDVVINAPRALLQLEGETKLAVLHWTLGSDFHHVYSEGKNQ